jgi:hypothetical protein
MKLKVGQPPTVVVAHRAMEDALENLFFQMVG